MLDRCRVKRYESRGTPCQFSNVRPYHNGTSCCWLDLFSSDQVNVGDPPTLSQNLRLACGVSTNAHSVGTSPEMTDLPSSVRSALRRLARRVAVGQFLDVWPRWAIGGLLIGGTIA